MKHRLRPIKKILIEVPLSVITKTWYRIDGVMVSVLEYRKTRVRTPRSGQIKDYKIGIWYFSANYATLMSKSKDWLARNQDNVSEWIDMSTRGLLLQLATTIKIKLSVLV